ncbi:MAG TPA: hypothetical protein VF008_11725 [Niastella sp.]
MRLFLLFLIACCFSLQGFAQNRYIYSLYNVVRDPKTNKQDKILVLSHLADVVRFYDDKKAMQLAEEAISLAKKENDTRYKVYAYEVRSSIYLRRGNMDKSNRDMDSTLQFADQTNDIKAKSWAWFQKGLMLSFENKEKETLSAQLKALEFIKGKGYWKEEASIYYALYGVFTSWDDLDNTDKYALLALDAAKKSKNPNNLCESWQAVSTATEYRYRKTKNKLLLDSAIRSNMNAIAIYLEHEDQMHMIQLITIPCINIANAYNEHFPPSAQITDSIRRYATLAYNYAVKSKDIRTQAATLGLLNEDAKRNGNYSLAETYLIQALTLFFNDPNPDYYIRSSIFKGLAELAERKYDYPNALEYQKAYLEDYKKVYDAEQARTGRDMEAKYQAKEREQEIKFLKANEALHKKQKYLYIGIAITLLLGLLFMFRSYHFRLRYSLQRATILEQEKEEARLLAKLKEEEALLASLEQQKAELYASLQEKTALLKAEETARLQAEQQVILARNEMLQKEVMAGNLHMEQKTKVLKELKNQFEENPGKEIKASELNKVFKRQEHFDNDFEELKTELKEIHPEFYQRLQQKADNKLTTLDLKYCAYIFMKRSTKEMAVLLNVEPKSIRMSKYRLKQKLGLDKEDDLDVYISSVV